MRKVLYCLSLILFSSPVVLGQATSLAGDSQDLFAQPKSYVAPFVTNPPVIDGDIEEQVWEQAVWSDLFVDIEGDAKPKPYYETRVKMMWDKEYLYIATTLQEEHVWANLTKRDQIVFFDNDFEVFLDPNNTTHRYFEYEINALNTIFDLFLPKPYRTGSGALISWDSNRLKHAVKILGTLNNPNDKDKGWTVEMAIPFADVTIGNDTHVPKDGEIWRINFSRVQWEMKVVDGKYMKKLGPNGNALPENNWVWSPQGVINMHLPERWGYLQFSTKTSAKELPVFELPYSEMQRQYLWQVYYKQQEYKSKHKSFAGSLKDLGMKDAQSIEGKVNRLTLEATSNQFSATINDTHSAPISINQEGYISNY